MSFLIVHLRCAFFVKCNVLNYKMKKPYAQNSVNIGLHTVNYFKVPLSIKRSLSNKLTLSGTRNLMSSLTIKPP